MMVKIRPNLVSLTKTGRLEAKYFKLPGSIGKGILPKWLEIVNATPSVTTQ